MHRTIDAGGRVIEHVHLIDEETMKYAVKKDTWFASQYLAFTIDVPGLTELQNTERRSV